jgi:hypothetical protein
MQAYVATAVLTENPHGPRHAGFLLWILIGRQAPIILRKYAVEFVRGNGSFGMDAEEAACATNTDQTIRSSRE